MEGWGVMKIMEQLKSCGIEVKRLTHDRDASTFKNVLQVFEDVAESYCTSMINANIVSFYDWYVRTWVQELL